MYNSYMFRYLYMCNIFLVRPVQPIGQIGISEVMRPDVRLVDGWLSSVTNHQTTSSGKAYTKVFIYIYIYTMGQHVANQLDD